MDDLPARLADFLESITSRIRALTVDRVARWIKVSSLGMIALTLGIMALIFLLLTVYGALEIPLGPDGAFAVLGGVVLIAGAVLWRKRTKIT
jgi:archaellum biogenesis protein FlaJ (TadC family)